MDTLLKLVFVIKSKRLVSTKWYATFLVLLFVFSCVEPYEGAIGTFEDVLVIDALITNEVKHQEVRLTRSYPFEDRVPEGEKNAQVMVVGDNGSSFQFENSEEGVYTSAVPFGAQPNVAYQLQIITEDGAVYGSNEMALPVASTAIESVVVERMLNEEGVDGMRIAVNSNDANGNSQLYRLDYEETFKVIAPYWSPYDLVVRNEGFSTIDLRVILREREERVCYATQNSQDILLRTTQGLTEDRLRDFEVRFIPKDDYILTYRYSMLVKQYVQTPEAFAYYETLQGLSKSSENVFSEDQPGFLRGNVFSTNNPDEKVAGFFEVATVATERIFFSFEDYFAGEERPPYKYFCSLVAPSSEGARGQRPLLNSIYKDELRYYDINFNRIAGGGDYLMVRPECGDCTTIGSNKIPEFWVE